MLRKDNYKGNVLKQNNINSLVLDRFKRRTTPRTRGRQVIVKFKGHLGLVSLIEILINLISKQLVFNFQFTFLNLLSKLKKKYDFIVSILFQHLNLKNMYITKAINV